MVSDFFTKISIFSPRSITLFMFSSACYSSSESSFLRDENLSILAGLLQSVMVLVKNGTKSLSECATAVFLLAGQYFLKNSSWIFLRNETAILVSYYKNYPKSILMNQPSPKTRSPTWCKCKSCIWQYRTGQRFWPCCIFSVPIVLCKFTSVATCSKLPLKLVCEARTVQRPRATIEQIIDICLVGQSNGV